MYNSLRTADTVRLQEFQLSCDRTVDSTTGLISYTFNWTLGPPDLPYDLAEALNSLTLDFNEAAMTSDGILTTIPSISYTTRGFGRAELTRRFRNHIVPAVAILQPNVSGFFWIREVMPSLLQDTAKFEVKIVASPTNHTRR